ARLRVFRGGRARGGRARPASPRDVVRRLSALERRVEQALGSGDQRAARDRLRAALDQALAAVARLRRSTPRDLAELAGVLRAGAGAVRAAPATVRRLLGRGEAVIVCPESIHPKPFRDRYRLGRFGRGVFARLAIETATPIVPVAVIGAEEVHPVLARLDLPGRLLGLPALPITLTFPWLGLCGLVPLPTKCALLFADPLDVAVRHRPRDASDPAL